MAGLRESAAWTQDDIGNKLKNRVTGSRVQMMESGSHSEINIILNVLAPRLQELKEEGWLDANTLVINENLYKEVANACKKLRMSQYESFRSLCEQATAQRVNLEDFERKPKRYGRLGARSLSDLIEITNFICEHYKCKDLRGLLQKADEIPTIEDYDDDKKKEIGKAVGALIRFLGFSLKSLGERDGYTGISAFVNSKKSLSDKLIDWIPFVLREEWKNANPGKSLPEEADFFSSTSAREPEALVKAGQDHLIRSNAQTLVTAMTEKGLCLYELDMKALQAGISSLVKDRQTLAQAAKAAEITKPKIQQWLVRSLDPTKLHRGNTITTHEIAKMAAVLGVNDIFELEKIGKAALENGASTSPNGGSFAERTRKLRVRPQTGRG